MKKYIITVSILFLIVGFCTSQTETTPDREGTHSNNTVSSAGVLTITIGTPFLGEIAGFSNGDTDLEDYWLIPAGTTGLHTFSFPFDGIINNIDEFDITLIEYNDASRTIINGTTNVEHATAFNFNATKFYAIHIEFNNSCDECGVDYEGKLVAGTLPVELISFKGQHENGQIRLNWITASESNSDYFDIERSYDTKKFSTIGKLQAQGNSTDMKIYEYIDEASQVNIQYYRLKQVDKDGSFQYSKIISVNGSHKALSQVYPNPANDLIVIDVKSNETIQYLAIYNALGVQVFSDIKPTNVLNIKDLQKGQYILELKNEFGKQEFLKFIKQ